jgi:hypothetical protein
MTRLLHRFIAIAPITFVGGEWSRNPNGAAPRVPPRYAVDPFARGLEPPRIARSKDATTLSAVRIFLDSDPSQVIPNGPGMKHPTTIGVEPQEKCLNQP